MFIHFWTVSSRARIANDHAKISKTHFPERPHPTVRQKNKLKYTKLGTLKRLQQRFWQTGVCVCLNHVCTHVHVHISVVCVLSLCVCIYAFVCLCLCVHVSVGCLPLCMYVGTYVFLCLRVCISMCLFVVCDRENRQLEIRWVGIKTPNQPALLDSDTQCLADQQSLLVSRRLGEDLALGSSIDQTRPPVPICQSKNDPF